MNKFPPSSILVPMDLSEPSYVALEDAKLLARRFGARLDLLHIQSLPLSLAGFDLDADGGEAQALTKQMQEFRRWREDKMRGALAGFPAAKARVRSQTGWPPAGIADVARTRGADLVVMGTHGYAGLDRVLFGSVAEAVVRRATVPVLITHPKSAKLKIGRILVPCNMEPYADAALSYAMQWAKRLGARVDVLLVAPSGADEGEAKKVLSEHLAAVLGKAAASKLGLLIRRGDPRKEILEAAVRCDLIALSAHRRRFWSDFTLGSTAERVLRHSPAPVLAVPSVESKSAPAAKAESAGWLTNKIY